MTIHSPLWQQNDSYPASLDRQLISILFPTGGVSGSGDLQVTQRAAGINRSVDVAVGKGLVPGSDVVDQGTYVVWQDAFTNVALTAAPGTGLSRYDLIVARVRDADAIGGANNDWLPDVVTGTAASSPTVPSLPASCLLLAIVHVGSNVTTIANADITDARQVLGGQGWSTGDYKECASTAAQAGWLYCDGTAYSRTSYANLFAVISTTYGVGDGSTTFNIPDRRGRTGVGVGSVGTNSQPTITLGAVAGEASHTLSAGELAPHSHNGSGSVSGTTSGRTADHSHNTPGDTAYNSAGSTLGLMNNGNTYAGTTFGPQATSGESTDHAHVYSAGYSFTTNNGNSVSGTAHNNMQPYIGVAVFIKT